MKYIKLMSMGIKKIFVYKFSMILILCSSVANIFILQKFWFTLYGSEIYQYFYMANYSIISQFLGIIYRSKAPIVLANKIRTGTIAVELLRPWEYINAMLFEDLGTIIGNIMSFGLVLFIASKLLFDLYIPSVESMLLFLISAFLGFVILFLVRTLVALACFWLVEASALLILVNTVINLLSGQLLPSWLVPEWFEKLMKALPFVWIYQNPISIYIGVGETEIASGSYQILLMQFVWGLALYLVVMIVWRIAVDRLSIQGG